MLHCEKLLSHVPRDGIYLYVKLGQCKMCVAVPKYKEWKNEPRYPSDQELPQTIAGTPVQKMEFLLFFFFLVGASLGDLRVQVGRFWNTDSNSKVKMVIHLLDVEKKKWLNFPQGSQQLIRLQGNKWPHEFVKIINLIQLFTFVT